MIDIAASLKEIIKYLEENELILEQEPEVSLWRNVEADKTAAVELRKDENYGDHIAGE